MTGLNLTDRLSIDRLGPRGTGGTMTLKAYSTLRAADFVNAWAYVRRHGEAIERQIAENEDGH